MPIMSQRIIDEDSATAATNDTQYYEIKDTPCPAYAIKTLERLGDDLFLIQGQARTGLLMRSQKNMIVIRHNKRELTLINPIRLKPTDEKILRELGTVERLVRLSPLHDQDHDRYYLLNFPSCRRWAPLIADDDSNTRKSRGEKGDTLPVHRYLTDDDNAILPHCHVFSFHNTAQSEVAILILQDYVGNLLVTNSMRATSTQGGGNARVLIPLQWIRNMGKNGNRWHLRGDFERLLRMDFARLVGRHGDMAHVQVKEATVLAVERTFPVL